MSDGNVEIDTTECSRIVADYTVGFLLLSTKAGEEDAKSAGSGVLVSVGQLSGIMTAAHVLEKLPEKGELGLVTFPRMEGRQQRFKIDMLQTDRDSIKLGKWGPEGPDIGFLKLPQNTVGILKASKSFRNLDIALEKVRNPDAPAKKFIDAIVGVIDEKTAILAPRMPNTLTKEFEARFQVGQSTPLPEMHGLDRCLFCPNQDGDSPLPGSYEGTSGGGLWRIYWDIDTEGKVKFVEFRLCGIAFYQSDKIGANRVLTCHGPRSIYQQMIGRIKKRWPDACASA